MSVNIINKYIDLTKKQINTYMKLVFGTKLNTQYSNAYIEKYINARYYNYYNEDVSERLRNKILRVLKETEEELSINNIDDRDLLQKMTVFMQYILYFDDVVNCKDLKKKIERIAKLRKRLLKKEDTVFEKNVYSRMIEFKDKKQDLLENIETEDFYLKITNYPRRYNLYRVNLKHNIEMPPEYSDFAINKAFNSGIIKEDKLLVEYYLVTQRVLKDALKQKFNKQYIVEFADTIFKKVKKYRALLNIIDNSIAQESIIIKMQYEEYLNNKEKVHNMLRDGYRIAIVLDDEFVVNSKNVQTLDIFKYIILNKQLSTYEKIKEYKVQNIIEV